MAYSPIVKAYVDGIVSAQFPDPEPQPEPMQLADSGQVKSDAGAGFGTIGPIKRNKAQEALGYVGELLTKAGVELDKVGLDVPVLGRISLKDLTVGDSGKVLEDMADGFYPVEGGGNFISGTKRIKPDAALELLNIAPAVGAAAKIGGKAAVKGVTKAVEATKGMPVGLSVKEVGQGVDDLGFYSAAAKAVDAIQQPKGTGDQFLKQIEKTPGVKADELKWTGLDDFLKSKKTVTKTEVQDYLNQNRVEIKEVQLGGNKSDYPYRTADEWQGAIDQAEKAKNWDEAERITAAWESFELGGDTKFAKYTLPGGENYREIYLTLPPKTVSEAEARVILGATPDAKLSESDIFYASRKKQNDYIVPRAHSAGTNEADINRLAHLRVNDRIDADGKKVLFVEEVQSDWHQAGRKKGYKDPAIKKEYQALEQELTAVNREALPYTSKGEDAPQALIEKKVSLSERMDALDRKHREGVPNAPFKTAWHELAMKRAIQMAAEGGYDRIAFTTGKQQNARYSLSKQINEASAISNKDGTYNLVLEDKSGDEIAGFTNSGKKLTPQELEETIGKELAAKLIEGADKVKDKPWPKSASVNPAFFSVRGVDLDIGGEGMKGFYDNIVPKFLDKYSKKWDAKTGMTSIGVGKGKPTDYADFNEWQKAPGKTSEQVHFIEITPKMRESVVTKGQPLFAVGAGGAGAAATQEENK